MSDGAGWKDFTRSATARTEDAVSMVGPISKDTNGVAIVADDVSGFYLSLRYVFRTPPYFAGPY